MSGTHNGLNSNFSGVADMDRNNSVLVVDDEPNGFDVIEAHLYREGYDLSYASSGLEALNLLGVVEPDVILLDVMMPEMDGMEVCRQIKSDYKWKHIPILMVTALNSKDDLARSLDAGADDFLTKPISGIELRARVRSMLRIKHQYDGLQEMISLREDLSNMIVHDLRNPLTRILVGSSFLLESGLAQADSQTIQLIASAGRQLNSMINDLLIQAKMESGKMVLNRTEVNVTDLVTDALAEFQSVVNTKKIHLESQLSPASLLVSVDANLIRRLIDNLLANAYKFSPNNSSITVQVDYFDESSLGLGSEEWETRIGALVKREDWNRSFSENERISKFSPQDYLQPLTPSLQKPDSQAPKKVWIQITDEGSGISDDLKPRIFEKYEVGKVMKGVSQLGLGLAFCKMVVEAHGGMIFVEDNKPQGSRFTVVL